jgi:hypothetical protein
MRLAALALASGCVTPYVTSAHPDGPLTQLGCIDVALSATRRSEATGPVLVVSLGNRCEHHADVDLGALRVVAGNDSGATANATAYDPGNEIEPRTIAARESGDEWIEYRPSMPLDPIEWLDVDVGGVAPDAGRSEHWVRVKVAP